MRFAHSTDLWVDTQGLDPPGTVDTDILMDITFVGGGVLGMRNFDLILTPL